MIGSHVSANPASQLCEATNPRRSSSRESDPGHAWCARSTTIWAMAEPLIWRRASLRCGSQQAAVRLPPLILVKAAAPGPRFGATRWASRLVHRAGPVRAAGVNGAPLRLTRRLDLSDHQALGGLSTSHEGRRWCPSCSRSGPRSHPPWAQSEGRSSVGEPLPPPPASRAGSR